MSASSIVVIGAGRLGCAIAWAEAAAGSTVHLVARRASERLAIAEARGIEVHLLEAPSLEALPREASWFLCVPDAALAEVARAWGRLLDQADAALAWVAHGSGANDLEPLAQLAARGRAVIHPMRALPAQPHVDSLVGTPVSVLADSESAEQRALTHAARWGAEALPLVPGTDRRRYHLACSLAANHLTGLLAWAERLATDSLGAEGARKAVLSLAQSALERMAESGPAEALTGPAVRAELPTLQAHLAGLEADAQQGQRDAARYRSALAALLEEAQRGGRLSVEQMNELRQQLKLPDPLPPGDGA